MFTEQEQEPNEMCFIGSIVWDKDYRVVDFKLCDGTNNIFDFMDRAMLAQGNGTDFSKKHFFELLKEASCPEMEISIFVNFCIRHLRALTSPGISVQTSISRSGLMVLVSFLVSNLNSTNQVLKLG